MAPKSRFIAGRFEPEQQRKLIVISLETGEPGNMSAALRWLVDQAQMPSMSNSSTANTRRDAEPAREAAGVSL